MTLPPLRVRLIVGAIVLVAAIAAWWVGGRDDRPRVLTGYVEGESVYLAALSCLRSPDGRLGTPVARQCADLARHHVGLVQPRALLLLGDAVSKALLGLPMAQARGRWHEIPVYGGTVRAMVTLPPVYLLGQSAHKALAWADLQMLLDEVK